MAAKNPVTIIGALRKTVDAGERIIFLRPDFGIAALPTQGNVALGASLLLTGAGLAADKAGAQHASRKLASRSEQSMTRGDDSSVAHGRSELDKVIGPLLAARKAMQADELATVQRRDPQPATCFICTSSAENLIPLVSRFIQRSSGPGIENVLASETISQGLELLSLVCGPLAGFSVESSRNRIKVHCVPPPASAHPSRAAAMLATAPASYLADLLGGNIASWLEGFVASPSAGEATRNERRGFTASGWNGAGDRTGAGGSSVSPRRFRKWSAFKAAVASIVPSDSDEVAVYRTICTMALASELRLFADNGVIRPASEKDRETLVLLSELLCVEPNVLLDTLQTAPCPHPTLSNLLVPTPLVDQLHRFLSGWLLGALEARLSKIHVVMDSQAIVAVSRRLSGLNNVVGPSSVMSSSSTIRHADKFSVFSEALIANLIADHATAWCAKAFNLPGLQTRCNAIQHLQDRSGAVLSLLVLPTQRPEDEKRSGPASAKNGKKPIVESTRDKENALVECYGGKSPGAGAGNGKASSTLPASSAAIRQTARQRLEEAAGRRGKGSPTEPGEAALPPAQRKPSVEVYRKEVLEPLGDGPGSSIATGFKVLHSFGAWVQYFVPLPSEAQRQSGEDASAETAEALLGAVLKQLPSLFTAAIASTTPIFIECVSHEQLQLEGTITSASGVPTGDAQAPSIALSTAVLEKANSPAMIQTVPMEEFCRTYFPLLEPDALMALRVRHMQEKLSDAEFLRALCHTLELPEGSWELVGAGGGSAATSSQLSVRLTGYAVRELMKLKDGAKARLAAAAAAAARDQLADSFEEAEAQSAAAAEGRHIDPRPAQAPAPAPVHGPRKDRHRDPASGPTGDPAGSSDVLDREPTASRHGHALKQQQSQPLPPFRRRIDNNQGPTRSETKEAPNAVQRADDADANGRNPHVHSPEEKIAIAVRLNNAAALRLQAQAKKSAVQPSATSASAFASAPQQQLARTATSLRYDGAPSTSAAAVGTSPALGDGRQHKSVVDRKPAVVGPISSQVVPNYANSGRNPSRQIHTTPSKSVAMRSAVRQPAAATGKTPVRSGPHYQGGVPSASNAIDFSEFKKLFTPSEFGVSSNRKMSEMEDYGGAAGKGRHHRPHQTSIQEEDGSWVEENEGEEHGGGVGGVAGGKGQFSSLHRRSIAANDDEEGEEAEDIHSPWHQYFQ